MVMLALVDCVDWAEFLRVEVTLVHPLSSLLGMMAWYLLIEFVTKMLVTLWWK